MHDIVGASLIEYMRRTWRNMHLTVIRMWLNGDGDSEPQATENHKMYTGTVSQAWL